MGVVLTASLPLRIAQAVEARMRSRRDSAALAGLAVLVVLACSFALMLPALSLTHDNLNADGADALSVLAEETPEDGAGNSDEGAAKDQDDPGESAAPEKDEPADEPAETPQEAEGAEDDSASQPEAEAQDGGGQDSQEATEDSAEAAEVDEADDAADAEMPACSFDADLKDKKGNVVLSVAVDAPKGAFPEGTTMKVKSVKAASVRDKVEAAFEDDGRDAAEIADITAVDITFYDADGTEIEPAKKIEVRLTSDAVREAQNLVLVHIIDADKANQEPAVNPETGEPKEAEVVPSKLADKSDDCDTLVFTSDEFSIYAIVDAPKKAEAFGWSKMTTLAALAENASKGFVIGHVDGYYLTDQLFAITSTRTGITKTKPNQATPSRTGAAIYYLEVVEQAEGQLKAKVYCLDGDGSRKYVKQNSNSLLFVEEADAQTFTITAADAIVAHGFKLAGDSGFYWNMQGGAGGASIAAYNSASDANARMNFWLYESSNDDPYGLDGKTFGLIYEDNTVFSKALMAQESGTGLLAQGVPTLDMKDRSTVRYVTRDSDITEWTFHCVGENKYHITAEVDGQTKYLTIDGQNVSLQSSPDPVKSAIVIPYDAATDEGAYQFCVGSSMVVWNDGGDAGSFGASTDPEKGIRFNLAAKTALSEDDALIYSASKVSVSDTEHMPDGAKVVIYTRVWNEKALRYEFYVVDHDGTLLRAYDGGDTVQWVGNNLNTAEWDFTEYHFDETADPLVPNYYYELQNGYSQDYLAPHRASGDVLSDSTVGINLNGRRYGYDYTTIIAWDQDTYAYSGLRVQDGKLVPCTLDEADDFYFAIIDDQVRTEPTTTVETVDNAEYGITMKMIDFNNSVVNGRDSVQHAFFGSRPNNYDPGLLSTNLNDDGYPVTTSLTGHEDPLSNLFTGMTDVNHLFIQSIYNESGYFEYDSTSNFAHLNADGNFTVYDQLGSISDYGTTTGTHGQFLPYDDIDKGEYTPFTNQTDVLGRNLSDDNPRKGEKIYSAGTKDTVDYYFGMEMSASFTQTASGLDAWGHDIIFEFSGDDDFWLYVDGELVLDLGGVRSALAGSVNFRTGEVVQAGNKKTLYDIFWDNYRARGYGDDEIRKILDGVDGSEEYPGIFTVNANGEHVFKDYTKHTMRMFYMERGAGASNLHMRFNLAAVKQGTFTLSKKLSGTESASNALIAFPYQIYYRTQKDGEGEEHLLGENPGEADGVTYAETTVKVPYKDEFTPAGGTDPYKHVFMLKPGETAEVKLPDGATRYRVVECGVNPDVYDAVKINGAESIGGETNNLVGEAKRRDFNSGEDTLENRSSVQYDNQVAEGAMRNLTIQKRLYAEDGTKLLNYDDDKTTFSFRLFLGNENDDAASLPAADMYKYYVKDAEGNYCIWNAQKKEFESVGIKDFAALVLSEHYGEATNQTSMYGSITNVPVDHVIEVRGLIAGTQFKLEERANEIPKGYTLRLSDAYQRVDEGHEATSTSPISGTVEVGDDPSLRVNNQKGWGLTMEKAWSDADFMADHDPTYFAVYFANEDGALGDMVPDTLYQLGKNETSLYYFFESLASGKTFEDYEVHEVTVQPKDGEELVVAVDGKVTGGYASVTPVKDQCYQITVGGTPKGGSHHDGYVYTATYAKGAMTDRNENVRTDKWANSRPGIVLKKTDWNGASLSGAVFTLKNEIGEDVGAASYTSDADGLITTAYLPAGASYYLEETSAPKGYVVMPGRLKITVGDDYNVTVEGPEDYYEFEPGEGESASIVVKDRPAAFQVKKVDAKGRGPLSGVHFALYDQKKTIDGDVQIDTKPRAGYEDMSTDANGILAEVSLELPAGTYYLVETAPKEGYEAIPRDESLCFTIGADGVVSVNNAGYQDWLKIQTGDDGTVSYLVTIPNQRENDTRWVQFKKTDMGGHALGGAGFTLYLQDGGDALVLTSRDAGVQVDGQDVGGIMATADGDDVFELAVEQTPYVLAETTAPDGYLRLADVVNVYVNESRVTAQLGDTVTTFQVTGEGTKDDPCLVTITNSNGYELPSTGGMGVAPLYVAGALLVLAGAALLLRRRPAR